MAITDVLRNVNGYVDGRGYAGRLEMVSLPTLTVKTEDYRAGGMDGTARIDMGLEPLESSLESRAIDADLLRSWGVSTGNLVPWTLRGAVQSEDGAVRAVVAELRGWCSELEFGDWKPGEITNMKLKLECRFYRLQHDGRVIHEIDVDNMTRIIDGTDQLAAQRAALGI
jgi:hypothetical protein